MMEEYFNDVHTFFEKIIAWKEKTINPRENKLPSFKESERRKYKRYSLIILDGEIYLDNNIFYIPFRNEKVYKCIWLYMNFWKDDIGQIDHALRKIDKMSLRFSYKLTIKRFIKKYYTYRMERECFQNNKRLY